MRAPRRIWAVAAIHGEAERLADLHDLLRTRMELCDRVVYLGNMIGRGSQVRECLDELLRFRLAVIARPHGDAEDVVFLRGSQEEMWQKLLQLQFAVDPKGVLTWMLHQGVGATLATYGITVEEARHAAGAGPASLTRWTAGLRNAIQAHPGHQQVMAALKRAAYSDDRALLFVNSGLDPTRPLEAQSDSFWWSSGAYSALAAPYDGFRRVVRGFDPSHAGVDLEAFAATLDGGCGFGGPLVAACFGSDGALLDRLEA
ncbi:MAG: hypothetical protein ACREDZ_18010 [Kiloniellales bacterium]